MNKNKLKAYAPAARKIFIQTVTDRAHFWGLSEKETLPLEEKGDIAIIGGRPFPRNIAGSRRALEDRICRDGFDQVMEAVAYTWFNRFMALRYMEIHGYLEHGFHVLSNPNGGPIPEILEQAAKVDLPGLDKQKVIELKLDGTKDSELYRMLLVAQCNALHAAMPFLFERINDETELLLPDNLLHSDSLIRKLVTEIDEEDWREVEIIGWLYQFYISEKKDQVIGAVVKSEDIPAATQLFTPKWIVKYMVQNSLGRMWLATYPNSPLRAKMEYYIEPAEQTEEVKAQLKAITPVALNPELMTFLDPASGSGHILVEAYDILKEIYLERGYSSKDFPRLILEKNLYGLDIDDRAAQMTGFALLMKARQDDRRILQNGNAPMLNVMAIQESKDLNAKEIAANLIDKTTTEISKQDINELVDIFQHGKTFGSLITIPELLAEKLPALLDKINAKLQSDDMFARQAAEGMLPIVRQAKILAGKYDCVVTNPPYMGNSYFMPILKEFVSTNFIAGKADLYGCFTERALAICKTAGLVAMITIPNWMFLSSFGNLRNKILNESFISSMLHNGRGVFGSDFGSCAFVLGRAHIKGFNGCYKKLFTRQGSVSNNNELSQAFFECKPHFASAFDFESIPGSPIAYWIKNFSVFKGRRFDSLFVPGGRWKTHGDSKYTRFWWEIDNQSCRWKGYLKGGEYRPFFGNEYHVFDFSPGAIAFYEQHGGVCNKMFWNKPGITWSLITVSANSFRVKREQCEHSSGSPTIFPKVSDRRIAAIAISILNSRPAREILQVLNPTVNLTVSDVLKMPFPVFLDNEESLLCETGNRLADLYQWIWDGNEASRQYGPISIHFNKADGTINNSFHVFQDKLTKVSKEITELQKDVDDLVSNKYGMENSDDDGTELIEQLTSLNEQSFAIKILCYAIGCMMGRYSMDQPGLVYANSGNIGFDHTKYKSFPADDDGIVPVMDMEWFDDDAAKRFESFLKVAWSADTLEENLKFIADSLSTKSGETPRDTIRRYISTQFFKDHLQTYKKRPIYWLFSSGKQRAFECLVYLHRYNESTLSRMRNEYVTPLQGKLAARTDFLANEIEAAATTSARNKLQKQLDTLKKKRVELAAFDDLLRHYADQRITLDLDDGVKVNYGKFGDLLAEVKAITGGSEG